MLKWFPSSFVMQVHFPVVQIQKPCPNFTGLCSTDMVWSAFFDTTVMAWKRSSGWISSRIFRRKRWRTMKLVRAGVGALQGLVIQAFFPFSLPGSTQVTSHLLVPWASLFSTPHQPGFSLTLPLLSCRPTLWTGEVLGLLEILQSQKFGHWPQTSRIPRQIPTSGRLPSGCEWKSLLFLTPVLERKLDQRSGYLGSCPSCATGLGTLTGLQL